jgi:hypothetical protein
VDEKYVLQKEFVERPVYFVKQSNAFLWRGSGNPFERRFIWAMNGAVHRTVFV